MTKHLAAPDETQRLLHELTVHQVELESQNEELRRAHVELDALRARYFDLYDLAPVGYVTLNEKNQILQSNLTAATLLGVPRRALEQRSLSRFVAAEDQEIFYRHQRLLVDTGNAPPCELRIRTGNGTTLWVQLSSSMTEGPPGKRLQRTVLSDINERKQLQLSSEHQRDILESMAIGRPLLVTLADIVRRYEAKLGGAMGSVMLLAADGEELRQAVSPTLPSDLYGEIQAAAAGPHLTAVRTKAAVVVADVWTGLDALGYRESARAHGIRACWSVPLVGRSSVVLGTLLFTFDAPRAARPGELAVLERGAHLVSLTVERHTAECALLQSREENAKLEAQLHQASKMESIGRLAGGVAHDFNNMLGVIMGHVDLAMEEMNPTSLREDLAAIKGAAERSVALTRQLLAFARKQVVVADVLDLNELLAATLGMIRRLVGEDIRLDWRPGADLWRIKVDPSQIDQMVTNLCVNARDALADVGQITITTSNCVWPGGVDSEPGDYVQLVVADNGAGMTEDVLAHIFEPFFTTKALGKGTGLGLATVYGAVRQNQGFITVESTLGHGSRFAVHLPRYVGGSGPARSMGVTSGARGSETILVVEDEPAILLLSERLLEAQGYTVLKADGPGAALRIVRERGANVDLLITDVVMPEMNGRDLADAVAALYPRIRVLFMSGYTADVIAPRGVLAEGIHFIHKPFTKQDLMAKVREVLDSTIHVSA